MTAFWAIYRREMLGLWVTPLAWVLWVVFLLLEGGIFYSIVIHFTTLPEISVDSGPLQAFFGQESILLLLTLILLCPALSMRLFAEERARGTIEPLLTAPVSATSVVLGKYLAVLSTYVGMWLPTLLYVLILRRAGSVDPRVVASSYAGLFGVGAAYLAIGTLMSTLTKSQLVALLLTLLFVFGMFVMGIGEYVFAEGLFHDLCAHVSVAAQMEEFSRGIVESRRVVFDASIVALCLFLSVRVVDSWRWG
ncbi:MAG TPA: ABC transporter permease [Polyangiaceae bacterium]|nr:ABC transporter permease [Polyangiaceae bacterium]